MKSKTPQKQKASKPQHVFRRIRDPLVNDASNLSPSAVALVADGSGNANLTYALSPLGISGLTATSTSATGPINFLSTAFYAPYLPWLYNQARNFERYRVLSATLIITGNVGSSATGRMLVDSSTDIADNVTPVTVGLSTGGLVFDVASLAAKEKRFQLDVDSSWKKVSNRTYTAPSVTLALPTSSANDLLFSNIYISVVGATASGTAGSFTVANFAMEYDVEFRDPISYGANA